ncbi:MAG: Uncharacterized protein XD63_0087 [Thermoanaerobacterales bacterium 50_218]|nr:MAG: Uncharacterized protein XD63_0087 [Thermoanaerobacterales bacterium 50_218]HAA90330.1 hypothetical protein [Peptococcaceae bacterium]
METGCPVCNGLTEILERCPDCSSPMEDLGTTETYHDPYGPYEAIDTGETAGNKAYTGDAQCVHLLYCPNCGRNVLYSVDVKTNAQTT